MKRYSQTVLFVAALSFALGACGGAAPADSSPTTSDRAVLANPTASPDGVVAGPSESGLPADVETYYKTMVFIEGTAQLMAKFDLASLTTNQAAFAPLMMIPGVMDDKVIWAQKESLPGSLASAWGKALEAEQGLIAALENLLMMQLSQQEFLQVVAENSALASEAVAETEAVLAREGASAQAIEALKRAALSEMGEAYQTFASLLAAGQTLDDDDSE